MNDVTPSSEDETAAVFEARFSSILDTVVDGVVIIDESGRILTFNKTCETLFGYSQSEMIGENVRKIMPDHFAREHDSYLHNYRTTGVKRIIGIGREVVAEHKDGTAIPIELSVGESNTPVGRQFIGILRDIRSRKSVEERVNQLQAQLVHMARVNAMDEMGAAIAHELNQPLTAVMLYLQTAMRRARNNGDAQIDDKTVELMSKAVREAERAGSIMQSMRQFIEKRDPQRSEVDLVELVHSSIEFTVLGTNARSVRIERQDENGSELVMADPVQIQQIVVNLVRNAIEAVQERDPKWIRVGTYRDEACACVDVFDSGPGIAPDRVDTLFKTFSSGKRDGLGLGLAISRAIAQNHGGDLVVEPGGDGIGARFVLRLPLN